MKIQKKIVLACLLVIISIILIGKTTHIDAATAENVDIRFVFTTDLHGRLTTTDYELNKEFKTGSLAKAYTLIEKARQEKMKSNTFTFDVGDVLYDYTTENIFEMEPNAIQPIFRTMATLGYDAIVLGNHEFDYGYDYIMNQMKGSGLKDICVVSNVFDAKTGKTVFHSNMMLTRNVKTKSGKIRTVKIGVIGETVPVLSRKRENYLDVLVTEDIVKNATKQAKLLKARGADVIVVLAHSGFGTENPAEMSKDASYALTKIPEVDVVLCGHSHRMFPSNAPESAGYYKYSGVDKKTGLVNGKNIVMANDKGQSIGVVDLTLSFADKQTKITRRKSEIRLVKESTKANEAINNGFGEWKDIFEAAANNFVGTVSEGKALSNYFGLVEDSSSIQLLNNAKINYALQYINSTAKQYKNHPVIAASNHTRYGQLSADDYANISGRISEANLSAIAPFNKYLFLYEITGKELKEWLEWSASAYETLNKSVTWSDELMNAASKTSGAKSLISEEWLDEWSSFYVFDGVNYTINPSVEPRYNYYGAQINNTNRVTNISYNGAPITDDMKFILATESITGNKIKALNGIEHKAIRKGINKSLSVLVDYVKEISQTGNIVPCVDNNWNISLPEGHSFLLKLSTLADLDSEFNEWNRTLILTDNQYSYCKIDYKSIAEDKDPPNIVLASTNKAKTNQNIDVAVHVTDRSGLKTIKYLFGDYNESYYAWDIVSPMENHIFTASANGIYTVYAEDNVGNKSVASIEINNINRGILQVPSINSYTNRTTRITGKAEPGAEIYFDTVDGYYIGQVDDKGTFAYELPSQKAGDKVIVYVKDSTGRVSEKVTVVVKRTGPNRPEVTLIENNKTEITGNTRDNIRTIFAIVGNNVYVSSKDGEKAYKSSEKYVSSKKIIKTNVSIKNSGNFSISIPALRSSTSVTVYALDYIGRVSKANISKVEHVAPNPPTVYATCNSDNQVHGRIFTKEPGTIYKVTVTAGGLQYQADSDENGYFEVPVGLMDAGERIRIYATDKVDNQIRKSAVISYVVKDVKDFRNNNGYEYVSINEVTNKSESITGTCEDGNVDVIIKIGDEIVVVTADKDGNFEYPLNKKLRAGIQVSAMVRLKKGGIVDASIGKVIVGKPYQPILLNKGIYNTTKTLQISSTEKLTITVLAGKDKYTTKKCVLDGNTKTYIYTVDINNINSGNNVSIYATNSAGNSTRLTLPVIQRAPNTPKVDPVDTNTDNITGTVNLILDSTNENNNKETPTVSNTKTKVFVKIGNTIYEGKVFDDGTFEIKIPKQKVNTPITIWGENALGKGPSRVFKVIKA